MGRIVICTVCKRDRFPHREELTVGILFSVPRPCGAGCGRTVTAATGYSVMRASELATANVRPASLETR